MDRSQCVTLVRGLLIGLAFVGCGTQQNDEPTTQTKSALTSPPQFTPYVVYPTGSRAEAVAIGDLDGDGRKDVAVTTSVAGDVANDRMLHVFLQEVDGTLRPRVQYPLGNGLPRSLDIGDVNGDGRADAVVGSTDGAAGNILILLQNASGTLDAAIAYPTPNAEHVKIGDFNGDGRLDVAGLIAGTAGDGLDVFLQTAGGTLAAPVTYHVPHGGVFDELDAGDVNNDGLTDLVVMSGGNLSLPDVSVLVQAADGTLAAPAGYDVPGDLEFQQPQSINISGIAVGDVTGDGLKDVICSPGDGVNRLAVLAQNPQGTLALGGYARSMPGTAAAIVLADIEGDGQGDVLQIHNTAPYLVLWRQTLGGVFSPVQTYPIPQVATFYRPESLAVGDISGDALGDATIADPERGLVVLRRVSDPPPRVALTAPLSVTVFTGAPVDLSWTASADATAFDLSASFDNGATFSPIPGCQGLPGTARGCTWPSPGPAATGVRVRITAIDAAGYTGASQSTIDLVTPALTVTMPIMVVNVGATASITWTTNLPLTSTLRIEISRDGGAFTTIAPAAPNTGSYAWTVTGPAASSAVIRITSNGPGIASATSTAPLRIVDPPALTITNPVAGSTFYALSTVVMWTTNVSLIGTVTVEYSFNGGTTFLAIASAFQNGTSGFANIQLPPLNTTNGKIRVTATPGGQAPLTATTGTFSVVMPAVAVTSPTAGSSVFVGAPLAVTWTNNLPPTATARIDLSWNGGTSYTTVASAAPNTGSFVWTATGPDTSSARARVTVTEPGSGSATTSTSGTFSIVTPTLSITNPAGGVFYTGTSLAIGWTSNLPASSAIRLELSRDGGNAFETLADAVPNTGSFAWTVTGPNASSALIRVTATDPVTVTGTSGLFVIDSPPLPIVLTSPAAGASWTIGVPQTITWTSSLPTTATVRIQLSRNEGSTFTNLSTSAPNSGSFTWTPTGAATTTALIRVTINGTPTATSTSGPFTLAAAAVTVTSPNTAVTWPIGSMRTISWTHNVGATADFQIELTRDGGTSWSVLAASVLGSGESTGSYDWTVTGPATTKAKVRVTWNGKTTVLDKSDVNFKIQ